MHFRAMADSIKASQIPYGVHLAAGYVNGDYAWAPEQFDGFTRDGLQVVRITVIPDPGLGDCLDIEKGDASPSQAAAWVKARQAAGQQNVAIYCDRSTWPAVRDACAGLHYYKWIATLDGTLTGDADAVQLGHGDGYDFSVVLNDAWHHSPTVAVPGWMWNRARADAAALAGLLGQAQL